MPLSLHSLSHFCPLFLICSSWPLSSRFIVIWSLFEYKASLPGVRMPRTSPRAVVFHFITNERKQTACVSPSLALPFKLWSLFLPKCSVCSSPKNLAWHKRGFVSSNKLFRQKIFLLCSSCRTKCHTGTSMASCQGKRKAMHAAGENGTEESFL